MMNRDGLDGIELHPAPAGARAAGDIRFALVDTTDGPDGLPIRAGVVPATDLASRSSYRFEFAPVVDSRFRRFRFELATTEASSGVGLVATRGDRYTDGALTVNGRRRWADLVFQTSAPAASIWSTLWTGRTESGASGRLVLALLAVNWLAMGVLFRVLGRVDRAG